MHTDIVGAGPAREAGPVVLEADKVGVEGALDHQVVDYADCLPILAAVDMNSCTVAASRMAHDTRWGVRECSGDSFGTSKDDYQ